MSNRPPPEHPSSGVMRTADHQRIIAELDALLAQLMHLMQRFETTGYNMAMKADYISLHELQARIIEQRQGHLRAMASAHSPALAQPCPPKATH